MSYKYSVCTTAFRSVSLVNDFIKPFLELGKEAQIVVVDNDSRDGTIEKLSEFGPQVRPISLRCSRGLGRQKAMELSEGEIIINVEFDVAYTGIKNAISYFERANPEKIYYFIVNGQKCNASLYIGRRNLFEMVGGFPNLNYAEDLYMNKVAKKMGILVEVKIDMEINCLTVRGMSSGTEARYEGRKLNQIKRRIIATRDILFVNRIGYRELMSKYKLKGFKALYIGIPEYLLGKLLIFTIEVPRLKD